MNENAPKSDQPDQSSQCPLNAALPKILEVLPLVKQVMSTVPTSEELRQMSQEEIEIQSEERKQVGEKLGEWLTSFNEWMESLPPQEPRKVYAQSQAGIEEMRADGCDPQEIHQAEARLAHREQGLLLIEPVQRAFAGVKLGNGVGLRAGRGLDDYENDPEVWARYEREDEKEDWTKLTSKEINEYSSSFSFFDDEGMRFHLPAFIIVELTEGLHSHGLDILLTNIDSDYKHDQFALLNPEQRSVVRRVLLHLQNDPDWNDELTAAITDLEDDDNHRNKWISKALAEYWTE